MKNAATVTLAETLDCADIPAIGAFSHSKILDLRCQPNGHARPIEEPVLKRLRNHFVEYEQLPMAMDDTGPCQDIHLCELIREKGEGVLVLSDDISQVATLLGLYKIPFESSVFYVVETGRGNITKPLPSGNRHSETEIASVAMMA